MVCSQKIASVLLYSCTEYRLEQVVKLLATGFFYVPEVHADEKRRLDKVMELKALQKLMCQ